MPDQTGEIRHQYLNDLGDRLEAHGLFVAFIAAVLVLLIIMTMYAILEARAKRRERAAWAARAAAERTTRSAGIDEGFRRGFHG